MVMREYEISVPASETHFYFQAIGTQVSGLPAHEPLLLM
jgi:hypothetical protein